MHSDTRIFGEMRKLGARSIIRPHGQRHYEMAQRTRGGSSLGHTTGPPDGQFAITSPGSRRPCPWYTNQVNSTFHHELVNPIDYPWTMLALINLPDTARHGAIGYMSSPSGGGDHRVYAVGSGDMATNGNAIIGLAYNTAYHNPGGSWGLGWMQVALRMPNSTTFQFVKDGVQVGSASPSALNYAGQIITFGGWGIQAGNNARVNFPIEWIAVFPSALSDAHLVHLVNCGQGPIAGSAFR